MIQLPLWPEPKRGAPNAVLRGALFAAIQGKGRQYMLRKELVSTQDGVTIRYTGAQLDQADLDVWEQALHLARTQALGTECYFTAHGFLKALGRATGKQNHEWLKAAFARLAATAVEITSGRRTYFGSLIDGGVRDEDTGRYVVDINPKLAAFYGRSAMDTDRLGAAPESYAASPWRLWLHGFYASHAAPYPLRVEPICTSSAAARPSSSSISSRTWAGRSRDLEAVGAIKSFEIRRPTWCTSGPCRARVSRSTWLLVGRPDRRLEIGTVVLSDRGTVVLSDRGTVVLSDRGTVVLSDRGPRPNPSKDPSLFQALSGSAQNPLIFF